MPIYDFECDGCGNTKEVVCRFNDRPKYEMCLCGGRMFHVFSAGTVYCGNQDAAWLKTVPDIINKDTDNPVAREFIKNPTRENYKSWMKSEGLRPLERNEPLKPPPTDMTNIRKEVWNKHRERSRLEI